MRDYSYGISSVWNKDADVQEPLLNGVLQSIRGIENQNLREKLLAYLKGMGAFFVPDGEYLIEHFGEDIVMSRHAIFTAYSTCYLAERVAIPMRFADGSVCGFIGYDKKPEGWPEDVAFTKYRYPSKIVFDKSRYMFIEPNELERAFEEDYICIVDGLFDKMILQVLGINAVSLCGSALTPWHVNYLNLIKHKVVIGDNDLAGRSLFRQCKYKLSGCVEIQQPFTGDIDEYLRTDYAVETLLSVIAEMKSEGFLLSKVIKESPNGQRQKIKAEETKVF